MRIRAWGPLFALMTLFAAGLTGMALQHSKPHNQGEPTKAEQRDRPATKAVTQTAPDQSDKKGKNEKGWTDPLLVLFNGLLTLFTWLLYRATQGLFKETAGLRDAAAEQSRDMKASIEVARQSAEAAQAQVAIMAVIEGPMPLVNQIKLAQYTQIPGETIISDPLQPGPIPPNCRILVAVENKGRTTLRIVELCIEKFIGADLPSIPNYGHATSFNFYLEKGPIWLRGSDEQIVVGPGDIGAMHAVYPSRGAFWVYGYFAYPDLLNRRIEHKFCVRWDQTVGFVPDNRAGYT